MESYEVLLERYPRGDYTDEEWEYVCNTIMKKLENKEELDAIELDVAHEAFEYIDTEYLEHWKDSYWRANYIFRIDNGDIYSAVCVYSPEWGWDDFDAQVCKKVEKKEVMVEKWVEVE